MKHWIFALGVLLSTAAAAMEVDMAPVSPAQLQDLGTQAPRVIDVRSPGEYQAGHVPGAINIPFDQIGQRLAEVGAADQPVVLYCQSGRSAGLAAEVLSGAGYGKLQHLEGDFPGWKASGAPVAH